MGTDLPPSVRFVARRGRSEIVGIRVSKVTVESPTTVRVTVFVGEDVPLGALRITLEGEGVDPTNSLSLEVTL